MFSRRAVADLATERERLERFDLYLYDVMTSPRLAGQIVFEYGTLVRSIESWHGLRVLDIGTGRSTLPRWMSSMGAVVTTFDLAAPVERTAAGFQARIDRFVATPAGHVRGVAGDMLALPFRDEAFDLVTSLSVLEHLDTEFPDRTYVDPPEQQRRLAQALDEMVRVTARRGRIYITSECCDYASATSDSWRPAYYYRQGPDLSAAWPVDEVPRLFYEGLVARGCRLSTEPTFHADDLKDTDRWTSRGPYFSGFSVLAART